MNYTSLSLAMDIKYLIKTPDKGLEPLTLGLKVPRSTD